MPSSSGVALIRMQLLKGIRVKCKILVSKVLRVLKGALSCRRTCVMMLVKGLGV